MGKSKSNLFPSRLPVITLYFRSRLFVSVIIGYTAQGVSEKKSSSGKVINVIVFE